MKTEITNEVSLGVTIGMLTLFFGIMVFMYNSLHEDILRIDATIQKREGNFVKLLETHTSYQNAAMARIEKTLDRVERNLDRVSERLATVTDIVLENKAYRDEANSR